MVRPEPVNQPGVVDRRKLVEDQLERILASPLFARSESLSRLLRHVVEVTLAGSAASLREYSLGGGGHIEDTWDGHNDCIGNHKLHAGETDQPIAALIADLKRTGLWDETLLIWGGEFGRTPTSEGVGKPGRDHNWYGFTMWLAGAGVKGGQAIGATDELGFRAVEDRCHVSDLHATILSLMGLDHTKLTYFYSGMNTRLTGVRGNVVQKVMA